MPREEVGARFRLVWISLFAIFSPRLLGVHTSCFPTSPLPRLSLAIVFSTLLPSLLPPLFLILPSARFVAAGGLSSLVAVLASPAVLADARAAAAACGAIQRVTSRSSANKRTFVQVGTTTCHVPYVAPTRVYASHVPVHALTRACTVPSL